MREINPRSGSGSGQKKSGGEMSKPAIFSIVVLIIAVVILVVVLVSGMLFVKDAKKSELVSIDDSKYYAVFLSNGQVYFGHLNNYNTSSPELSDIYYLQLAKSPQASSEQEQAEGQEGQEGEVLEQTEQGTDQSQGLTLIKLGEELHGPEDSMILNKEQILFIEKLKDDGQVAEAIKKHEEEK